MAQPARTPSAIKQSSDDHLGRDDFDRLARLVGERCGIQLPAAKQTMLEGRLRRRARTLGIASLDGYCRYLFDADNLVDEAPHLINAVTTNKTDFFREPVHFDVLVKEILPDFAARTGRPMRVWSAACSTGAEPYTLAMVLDAYAARHGGPGYGILATDIDTEVLETARRGVYPRDMVEPVPPALRQAYVMESRDRTCDDVRISPTLRAAVGFARLNLMDSAYPVGKPMDVIFCRNVLIYFNKATQRQVVSRLVDALNPGGFLILGHSEGAAASDDRLNQVVNTIYRRS
jgi:chemotaxis protein methyltransferase CheR